MHRISIIGTAFLISLVGLLSSSCTKDNKVSGKIYHAVTGESLVGQTVLVYKDGKKVSAVTDDQGSFSLNAPAGQSDYFIDLHLASNQKVLEEDAEYYFSGNVDRTYRYIEKMKGTVKLINLDSLNVAREWKGFSAAVVSEFIGTTGGSGEVQKILLTNTGNMDFYPELYSGWNYIFGYIHYFDPEVNSPTYFEDSVFIDTPEQLETKKIRFN